MNISKPDFVKALNRNIFAAEALRYSPAWSILRGQASRRRQKPEESDGLPTETSRTPHNPPHIMRHRNDIFYGCHFLL
jgi:hypothetical protein